jgi:hypothetical protein
VASAIAEVAAARGAPGLALDQEGCAELRVGALSVTLMLASEPVDLLWLYADLGDVPDEPELLRGLMRLGFVSWTSGQLTLGLSSDGRRMVGYSTVPVATLTKDTLASALDRLYQGAEAILDRLAHRQFDLDDGPAPSSPGGAGATRV